MPDPILLAALAGSTAFLGWRLAGIRRALAPVPTPAHPAPPRPDHSAALARVEAELDLARRKAVEAGVARGAFLADISHELRTPMNAAIGFAELLLESRLEPAQRRQVELIAESGRSMLRLLGDLLDVARIESGDLRIVAEPTDIREALGHCVDLMRPIAEARGLKLSLRSEPAVPDMVPLDRTRLRQVMLNLIGNAVKFTDEGKVEVEVRLAGQDQIAISVIDTGQGMSAERQAVVFDPFPRSAQAPARASASPAASGAAGTGLGLALTRSLVGAMGGTIGVQSAPGLGSCFTVALPIQAQPARSARSVRAAGNPAELSLKGRRVLVAEDHEINQELMLAMLQTLGMEPVLVIDGQQAVEAVETASASGLPFDVVLMDLRMDGMDGLEASQRIREAGFTAAQLPIIALTANCLPDDMAACTAAGMQAHLAKPIRIEQLGRTLREVLATAQADAGTATGAATGGMALDLIHHAPADPATVHRLESRYRKRKQALFSQLRETLAAPAEKADQADWKGITAQLHKLAGVAANFGEQRLGQLAGRLEQDLRREQAASKRLGLLTRDWPALEDAARPPR